MSKGKDKAKQKLNKCLSNVIKLNYRLIRRMKKNSQDFFMTETCKCVQDSRYQIAFRMMPNDNCEKYSLSYSQKDFYAIVLQGPIRAEDDFTVETIKYYKRAYPQALIVVSTWKDENPSDIKKIRDCGVELILCDKPEKTGSLMVNYQLKNSLAGIKRAEELGAKYIAKTRTDQRVNKAHVFEYLTGLMDSFPHSNSRKKRIVTLSMNYGNLFYPYLISDFFYYGTTADMLNLFSIPLDNRDRVVAVKELATRREFSEKEIAPEVYIIKEYMRKLGYKCDNSIRDYWNGVKNEMICVGQKDLDLICPKYEDKYRLHHCYGDYYEDDSKEKMKTENFDFVNWLNLYSGTLEYKSEYEKYADVVFK